MVAPMFIQSISRLYLFVELEGIEPSSKQGNHTLSTCLSWPSLSGYDKTQATNHSRIL